MTDIAGRYPLSTGDSQAVPLEIIRPEGLIMLQFSKNSPSTPVTLSDSYDCFSLHSDVQCMIQFAASNASAAVPANGVFVAGALCVPAQTVLIMSPPIGKRSISVISTKDPGTLIIQAIQTWSGLSLKNQLVRR